MGPSSSPCPFPFPFTLGPSEADRHLEPRGDVVCETCARDATHEHLASHHVFPGRTRQVDLVVRNAQRGPWWSDERRGRDAGMRPRQTYRASSWIGRRPCLRGRTLLLSSLGGRATSGMRENETVDARVVTTTPFPTATCLNVPHISLFLLASIPVENSFTSTTEGLPGGPTPTGAHTM